MGASSRRTSGRWPLLGQALLAGGALGVLGVAGGGLFLHDAAGLLTASTGVIVTILSALAVGIWAGTPGALAPESPLRARWFAAGLATGAAGLFATVWGAYPALREGVLARVLALVLLVAAPLYTLGLLLPALLAWAEQRDESLAADEELGPAAWQPLGTLLAGVLGGAAVGVALAGLVLIPLIGAGPVLLGTGAALILPTLLPEPPAPPTEERLLYETETPLGTIRVAEAVFPGNRQPERRLYVNDEEESGELVRSGAPTLAYIAAAEQWFAETARRGDSYLFLGGGAYTLPRRVAERDPRAAITVVELDPEVTRLAYRFFGLRRQHGILSVHGDARAYLERSPADRFDRIFLDVYGGQEMLPYSLVTREALERLRRTLKPDGMLAMNAIGITAGSGSARFWSLVRTVGEVFPAIALYTHLGPDYPERQNVLIAAGATIGQEFPVRAGLFDRWLEEGWPDRSESIVFRDLFPDVRPAEPAARETADRGAGSS